jgi:O-antigen/teichoic acid export membrane protein
VSVPQEGHPARPEARSLRADVFLMAGVKSAGLVLALAVSVAIARSLGPSGRGLTAVVFGFVAVLTQVGTLGVISANAYFVAREPGLRTAIISNAVWLAAVIGSLLVGIGLLIYWLFPQAVKGVTTVELAVALTSLPLQLGANYLQSILLGEGRTLRYNLSELGLGAFTLVAVVVAVGALRVGVVGVLVTLATVRLTSFAYYAAVLTSRRAGFRFRRPELHVARRMLGYGFRVYIATVLAFLVVRVDMLLVNAYLGARQAGLYAVAVSFADAVMLLPAAVATNVFARVARGLDAGSSAYVFRSVAFLYALICIVTVPLTGLLIPILFGSAFSRSVTLYWLLVPGVFSFGMMNILAQHFAGKGFPTSAVAVWPIGLAVNVAINVALLPSRGTAVASLASSAAYTVLLALYVRLFASEAGGYGPLRPRPREALALVLATIPRPSRLTLR